MKLKSITEIRNLHCKRVLLRLDLNVPLKRGKVLDDWKIVKVLPTLQYLIDQGAKVVIISHLGRPEGKRKNSLSLKPVAKHLEKLTNEKITFLKDKIGSISLRRKISSAKCGSFAMLENIRFYKKELENSKEFAKKFKGFCDCFVNDAFASSHRNHTSVSAITKVLPSFAGLLLQEEIKNLEKVIKNPKKPFVVMLGGAKTSTKIPIIENLLPIADAILLGGGVANTFLASQGYKMNGSLVDEKYLDIAKKLSKNKKIYLPKDVIVGDKKRFNNASLKEINSEKEIIANKKIAVFDIGPRTIKEYSSMLRQARTIVWNGPMGIFEQQEFSHGTVSLGRLIASRSRGKVYGVAGGGETIEAIRLTKMEEYVDWVSTGGGAMLSFLGGEKLPGIIPLVKKA